MCSQNMCENRPNVSTEIEPEANVYDENRSGYRYGFYEKSKYTIWRTKTFKRPALREYEMTRSR